MNWYQILISVPIGPIRCVNNVMFLKPENVKILGGEVEELLKENEYCNVLLKAMCRPITNTPNVDYEGKCRTW